MAVDDSYTKSLLHFDGNLTDESGKTWTSHGSPTIYPVAGKFGGSIGFTVDNTYLTTPYHSDFNFGYGDFTIDFWYKANSKDNLSSQYNNVFQIGLGGYTPLLIAQINGHSDLTLFMSSSLSSWDIAENVAMGNFSVGVWKHYALTRSGNIFYVFCGGQLINSITSSSAISSSATTVYIGGGSHGKGLRSDIDELRVSKGIARWTSNFTPPTAPYSPPPSPICIPSALLSSSQALQGW